MSGPPIVAVCAIVKDELKNLLEWIAFYLNEGVTKILIYDNQSKDGTSRVLAALAAEFPIISILWESVEGVSPQASAYTDAVRRLAGKVDWCAFVDADEFMFGVGPGGLSAALADFEPSVSGVAVNQRVFGSSGHERYEPGLVTSRFTKRASLDYVENKFFKSVVRPDQVDKIWSPHDAVLGSGNYQMSDGSQLARSQDHTGRAESIVNGRIHLHHYILKSREEFTSKRERGGGMGATHELRLERYADASFFDSRDSKTNLIWDETLAERSSAILSTMKTLFASSANSMESAIIRHYLDIVSDRFHTRSADCEGGEKIDYRFLLNLRYRNDMNYEDIIERFYRSVIPRGTCVIDGGAHFGRHTFPLATIVGDKGEVIAVEAVSDFVQHIRNLKNKNGITNIRLVQSALFDARCDLEFDWVKSSPGYSGLNSQHAPPGSDVARIKCSAIKLDDISLNKRLSFIKLDLEGGEYRALVGGRKIIRDHRPIIVAENHGDSSATLNRYSKEDFFELIDDIDYTALDLFGRPFGHETWSADDSPHHNVLCHRTMIGEVKAAVERAVLSVQRSARAGTVSPGPSVRFA